MTDASKAIQSMTGLPAEVAARIEEARHDARAMFTHEECVKAWAHVRALEADLEALLTAAFESLTPEQRQVPREVWRTQPGVNHARQYIRSVWPDLAAALGDWAEARS